MSEFIASTLSKIPMTNPMTNQVKIPILVKKLHPDAIIPTFAREGDAGADVYACLNEKDRYNGLFLRPQTVIIIPTGLAFQIPEGYEIQVRSRSGLAAKEGIFVLNSPGTIDSGYRGELKIILSMQSQGFYKKYIKHGDRIAQLVVNKLPSVNFVEVDDISTETQRGTGGFGSTGV